jgi:protease-4
MLRRLFGGLWAALTWLRVSLANLVFLVILLLVVVMLTVDARPRVPDRGALVIDPSGRLVEQLSAADPLEKLLSAEDQPPPETLLKDVLDAVRHAREDTRIAAIVLATDALEGAGVTKTRDIATELEAFRATGRKVIAVADSYSQDQYLLAAQADEIWLHPMGIVELTGFAQYRNYYKGLLDKLRIDLHVFRSGTFKSAFESMEREDMSEADRLATGELLGEVWSVYTGMVTARRSLPPEAVDHYANAFDTILGKHAGDAAAAAMEHGFVDALKTTHEADKSLGELVGTDDEGHFKGIAFLDYLRAVRPPLGIGEEGSRPAVGVIVASGLILDGEQPAGTIGGDTLAALIRKAAKDEELKALVLRIDSPGGSGFASELIREALVEFRATGRPVVASMSSVAASGGYWIAAPADEIWAAPTTVTGSIGVLSAFPSLARGLHELGINNDGLGTTAMAGGLDPTRSLSPQWESVLRLANENTYRRFMGIVAEGRDLTLEQVAGVAEGRVWTGAQAEQNGLVDGLGNLDDAVTAAARLAGISEPATRYLEPPSDWRQLLLEQLSFARAVPLRALLERLGLGALAGAPLAALERLDDPLRPFAFCTNCAAY